MSTFDPEKIEGRIDRTVMGGTEIHMGFGGVKFQTMLELMDFAKLMALSGAAVPYHLRNNPGACLAICTKALRFGFDPFALAEHSFAMSKEVDTTITQPTGGRTTVKEKVETIAYDSYVLRAIIESHAPIKGRMKYSYEGEGDERKCTVSCVLRETGETISLTSVPLGKRKADIGTSEKGYLKGSPLWIAKPDQQQGYDTARDLCRLHFPEVLMGWYDKDEFDEYAKAAAAKDVTPAAGLKDRLAGNAGKGFSAERVAAQIGHSVGVTLDAGQPAKEPVPVAEAEAEAPKARTRKKAAAEPAKPSDTADAKGVRIMAGGHDVTDKMPLTKAELEKQASQPDADPTGEWLDEQIAVANNLKSLPELDELDPAVWKRLGADGRRKDLGPKWEAEGYDPNKIRLSAAD